MTRKNTRSIVKVRPVRVATTLDDVAEAGEQARAAMQAALRQTAAEVLATIAAAREYQAELLGTVRQAQAGHAAGSC